jgi:hypothetical protein
MAIKGKAKGRSRRVVAAPPKPPMYVRKKPVVRRPWFVATVVALAVAGILFGVFTSLANSHEKALKQRTSDAVTRFATVIEQTFPPAPDSQALPPTGFAIYPTLGTDLDGVAKGSKDVDGVTKGKSLVTSAKNSGDAIGKVKVRNLIPEDANVGEAPGAKGPGSTRVVLLESQFLLQQSFRIFEQVGGLMAQAATLEGKPRTAVIDEAKALATTAQTLFRRGYQKIQTIRAGLGILQQTGFPSGNGGLGGA